MRGVFSRRYQKNSQVEKNGSIGYLMLVLCPFEVQLFTSNPLKSYFMKLQMVVDYSSSIFWGYFFFLKKLAYFFEIYAVDPIPLTDLTSFFPYNFALL